MTDNSQNRIDKKMMENIYKDYGEKVTRYVRSKVFDQQEVEDLVSQVFIKVFSKINSFDKKKSALSTWIYTITANTVTDYCRKRRKIHVVLPDPEQGEGVPDVLVEDDTYEHIFTNATLEVLAEALGALSERERDLIVLRYYKNERLKTIAKMMKMSYSNVKIIHKQALKKLENYMNMQFS